MSLAQACDLSAIRIRYGLTRPAAVALAGIIVWCLTAAAAFAQPSAATDSLETLRTRVEARFEVLPLTDRLVLTPRSEALGLRAIELTGGTVAVDGVLLTGEELRGRLGADTEIVVQLSYLDPAARNQLFTAPAAAVSERTERAGAIDVERRRDRTGIHGGDRIRFGGGVTVERGEDIEGDVVAVGGPVDVDGRVRGDVVAVAGDLRLGPSADVSHDVVVIGGVLQRDPSARVGGRVREVSVAGIFARPRDWAEIGTSPRWWTQWWAGSALALLSSVIRAAVLGLLAALVVLLARTYVERISTRVEIEPLKAGAIGFLSQLLFLPLLVIITLVLVLTIVGIPLLLLLPFIVLGLGVVALVGFTAVSYRLGRVIGDRFGWPMRGAYGTTAIGLLVILSPVLLARLVAMAGGAAYSMSFGLSLLGTLVEYVAWTVGFGAVALSRFDGASFGHSGPAASAI